MGFSCGWAMATRTDGCFTPATSVQLPGGWYGAHPQGGGGRLGRSQHPCAEVEDDLYNIIDFGRTIGPLPLASPGARSDYLQNSTTREQKRLRVFFFHVRLRLRITIM